MIGKRGSVEIISVCEIAFPKYVIADSNGKRRDKERARGVIVAHADSQRSAGGVAGVVYNDVGGFPSAGVRGIVRIERNIKFRPFAEYGVAGFGSGFGRSVVGIVDKITEIARLFHAGIGIAVDIGKPAVAGLNDITAEAHLCFKGELFPARDADIIQFDSESGRSAVYRPQPEIRLRRSDRFGQSKHAGSEAEHCREREHYCKQLFHDRDPFCYMIT